MRQTHLLSPMKSPLRIAREKRGLTIVELARSANVDPGSLSRVERMEQGVSRELAERLVAVLAPDIDELMVIYPERYVLSGSPPPQTEASA